MVSPKPLWEKSGHQPWQPRFEMFLVALAAIRAALGLAVTPRLLSIDIDQNSPLRIGLVAFVALVFTIAGLFLYKRGADDSRARVLGVMLLLIGNAYAFTLLQLSARNFGVTFRPLLASASGLRPDAFLPYFVWLVAEIFPAPTAKPWLRKMITAGRHLSLAVGAWFFVLGLLRIFVFLKEVQLEPAFQKISMTMLLIWQITIPLAALALCVFLVKFRQLRKADKPRALLFFLASALSLTLPFLWIFLDAASIFFFDSSLAEETTFVTILTNLLLSSFPIIAIYTILAHRVLDVQSLAQNAIRHILARYSVALFSIGTIAFLIYFGWLNRDSTLTELFSGSSAIVLLTASAIGLVALLYRQPLLDFIDRSFFRERYNARRVLTELTEQVRGTRNLVDLSKLLERGVDLALHLERVSLLTELPGAGRFVDPRQQVRPLDPGSQLMTLISGSREPIAVDLESPRSPFLSLLEEDKLWLIENRVEMIAPAHSLDGSLIGLLALGPKRSELPFLREDRDLLAGVASSAGLVIELLGLKETVAPVAARPAAAAAEADAEPAPAGGPDETALECIACDRIFPPGSTECTNCHVDLEKTNAPYILRDLYRLDSRLGAGGMAVVYRAKDLKLGRAVAIKTLPRVNAEAAMRLRREARTAASVSHPGLAAIYGLETWRGVPMIITELLAGGTLADQLHEDPLKPLEAIDMARTIAQALAKIHTVGILHRDVKPSNIGYTEDGEVKLLDFGIARIQHDFRQEKPDGDTSTEVNGKSRIINTASMMLPRTATGQLVGTVTYLSPEAARGEKPDPGVDLWALAVCLYESLTAENLFYGRNFQDVLNQIRDLKIADVRQKAPTCPEPLALFLAQELDLDRSRRAEDGLEMATRLSQVRAKILAA